MHRVILNANPGQEGDHKDGNGLNNQRYNLRLCTSTQNKRNSGPQHNNTSGWLGVHWNKQYRLWDAQININGKTIHLGLFTDPVLAALARDDASRYYFGEFAYTNFIEV